MIDINKKYRTRSGNEVRIYSTDGIGDYPIHFAHKMQDGWQLECATINGKFYHNLVDDDLDLIEITPYEDINIDDKVWVWNDGGFKYKRHFAGICEDGRPMAWDSGSTSWSTEFKTIWKNCEKFVEGE